MVPKHPFILYGLMVPPSTLATVPEHPRILHASMISRPALSTHTLCNPHRKRVMTQQSRDAPLRTAALLRPADTH
eukprot:336304-Chlamydomonas_euryale.AAC.1